MYRNGVSVYICTWWDSGKILRKPECYTGVICTYMLVLVSLEISAIINLCYVINLYYVICDNAR